VLEKLNRYLADGGRRISAFHDTLSQAQVEFGETRDFTNINSSEALEALAEIRY
jgi:molybdopterin-guanine dinucleotide biosynthesis protein A